MKILAVNLNHIGDLLFTLPSFDLLLAREPDAQIVHLVSEATYPLVKDDPRFLEVVPRPRSGFREWARIAGGLRRRHRFAVAMSFSRTSPGLGFVTWRSGAPVRIGFAGASDTQLFFNRRVPYDDALHRVERNAALLGPLGVSPGVPPSMRLHLPDQRREEARQRLLATGSGPWVALCVGASVERKKWPLPRFIELAEQLHAAADARFALIGGKEDIAAAAGFAAAARVPFLSFCGSAGLMESASLLAACDIAIGGDTGPIQLAIAVDTPIVALYGSTEPHHTGPWKSRGEMLLHRLPCCGCSLSVPCPINIQCMQEITVEEALAAAIRVLCRSKG